MLYFYDTCVCYRAWQARTDASAAVAEVTQEVTQMPSLLQEGIQYSDPAALLNRGYANERRFPLYFMLYFLSVLTETHLEIHSSSS